ncbi:MAG: proline--tRNA ligase [Actinobacteria bacterium]|nr:MAG: proline--tRNA ligase [Actinomycetota bacterium]TMM22983.1 MAG: proline--tRNA ligase [Actinomycetota bacterium]
MALPSFADDFPAWYQEVVRQADLAENSLVRGTMVIKPYGYALWEAIRDALDLRFKETGHQNLYFPLFIPLRLLEREKEHVEGFAPEFAMVTHAGGEELGEPLVVRPTSETIIWDTYAKWVQSYRDLPLLYNQWANVVRWELRPRLFLRTTEFLWQEGHTAHETEEEAWEEARRMLEAYRQVAEDVMAMPVFLGRKTPAERFPGAVETFTIEALMRDRKALQAGTSHYLGQNFAKAYGVQYLGRDGEQHFAEATSWGASTRLVGGLIMAHGDEKGLRLPPGVAPIQVVVVPIFRNDEERGRVLGETERLAESWRAVGLRVKVDDRDDLRPGYKFADAELRGIPVRVEIGPRDLDASQVTVVRRDTGAKSAVGMDAAATTLTALQDEIQRSLFDEALAFREAHTTRVGSYDELRDAIEDPGGFVFGGWCGDAVCEAKVKAETKATIRFLPFEPEPTAGPCVVCAQAAVDTAAWAIAY